MAWIDRKNIMGIYTFTRTENEVHESPSKGYATWNVRMIGPEIEVSEPTFTMPLLTGTASYSGGSSRRGVCDSVWQYGYSLSYPTGSEAGYRFLVMDTTPISPGTTFNLPEGRVSSNTIVQTSEFFNNNNPNQRTIGVDISFDDANFGTYTTTDGFGGASFVGNIRSGELKDFITITLNAPPTFSKSDIYYDTSFDAPYAGITTASVDVYDLSAKYGGSITEVKLTIGNHSEIMSPTGTVSMLLQEVGTFTPTITVTDSRGQTQTEALADITVLGYNVPSVVLSVDRTDSTGAHDDEGTCAVVTGTFTFTDDIATLSQPTVSVSGLPSPTVTWYETRSSAGVLSNPVDWSDTSSYATGKMLYGLIGTLQPNESYVITVTPNDSEGIGAAMSVTLATAFYTVDFLAGGHGIAFGKPATQQDLFECDLDAQFNGKVNLWLSPIGSVIQYAGAVEPDGWFICNGRELSRTVYADLFDVIGTTYGDGDGSTTFNIPDFRGRLPQGVGTLGADSYVLGDTVDAGLPNIEGVATHNATYSGTNFDRNSATGAFYGATATSQHYLNGRAVGSGWYDIGFDASRSNAIYGNSDTVQPNTTVVNFIIKWKNVMASSSAITVEEMSDLLRPIGSVYETQDEDFDPNVSWGGIWTLIAESVVVDVTKRQVQGAINRQRGYWTSITAPTVDGYEFDFWGQIATSGWVSSLYVEYAASPTTNVWNVYSDGTGDGTFYIYAHYVKKETVYRWKRTA